ncbi:hypothetical protein PARMER_04125 [Parabacteroides merdae ATCC 43184]|nr:hypothetical protein PARMER_04125 [Parabacteroides merdae ATCC 43184]
MQRYSFAFYHIFNYQSFTFKYQSKLHEISLIRKTG